jgi:APA family basic amino acid/polyamine antiporter
MLKRNISTLRAASIGIANIVSGGIFIVNGVAAAIAGPPVILSFVLAGTVALLTALSNAELSSFIEETGVSYVFTKRAFEMFWAFLLGRFKYFDSIVGAAAVSVGFAAYFTETFGLNDILSIIIATMGLPAEY